MTRRPWICGIVLAAVAVVVYAGCISTLGIGSADLLVEFRVIDAASSRPIDAARIVIEPWDDAAEGRFELLTNSEGCARRLFPNMSIDSHSTRFGWVKQCYAAFPDLQCQVIAPRYPPSPAKPMRSLQIVRAVEYTGPRQARLQLQIALQAEG